MTTQRKPLRLAAMIFTAMLSLMAVAQPNVNKANIVGDITDDGNVDIADLNAIINMMLGKTAYVEVADINADNKIDIADVNGVINTMLGKGGTSVTTYTVNGVTFKMVAVEGGTFTMGATIEQENDANSDEKPAHQVTLNNYSIGQTEVTQELWLTVMGSNPSCFRYWFDNYLQRPVECVSWNDCQEFITKLNQLTGKSFRLPTEAEWEYAARGGNRSLGYKYAGSNNIDDVAWYWNNIPSQSSETDGYGTQTVATKAANELGLYDMSGNVWEWCQDRYGSYSSDPPAGPYGLYVLRGGSWIKPAKSCRVSHRFSSLHHNDSSPEFGLRLAL